MRRHSAKAGTAYCFASALRLRAPTENAFYRNGTATDFAERKKAKGLASANPLFYLVGRARFELATNGLKDVFVV